MNNDLVRFFKSLQNDIHSITMEDAESGGNPVQAFTQIATGMLIEGGETSNVTIAYDERNIGRAGQHMINGSAISENYETVDLFISIHNNGDEPTKLGKPDIDTAAKRVYNFFLKAINSQYVNELDPASQIFQLAHTLNQSQLIKDNLSSVRAIILTNNIYDSSVPEKEIFQPSGNGWSGELSFSFRIVDLNYLYNLSEKPYIPIEIDFSKYQWEVPCIKAPGIAEPYQSYLAILPGFILADIYDNNVDRIFEQNIRSFLQFSGKINKGIRETINKESEMFFAFNNGITATAEEIKMEIGNQGSMVISYIKDLQIVNGAQTTASIFHTWRKDRADLSKIAIPMKLNIISKKEDYAKIVQKIAKYANTQNKVTFSDLDANNSFYVQLEKLSRTIVAPVSFERNYQTFWFFERARAQYKNQRMKEGSTVNKQKVFDAKNPKNQIFTKEELAKYINTFSLVESTKNGKTSLLIGPHIVVRGSQKNHDSFIKYNLPKEPPDNIYYEDLIAKSILFRSAEAAYGRAPNAIGDMRFITVPYTLAYFHHLLGAEKLNWYKIWLNQSVSESLLDILKTLMIQIEKLIKEKSPGSLYVQFAKDEVCWNNIKNSGLKPDISPIEGDLIDQANPPKRTLKGAQETDKLYDEISILIINQLPHSIWQDILNWNLNNRKLNPSHISALTNLIQKRNFEPSIIHEALDLVSKYEPQLFNSDIEIPDDSLIYRATHMINWIKKNNHIIQNNYYIFLKRVRDGEEGDTVNNQVKLNAIKQYLHQYNYKGDEQF